MTIWQTPAVPLTSRDMAEWPYAVRLPMTDPHRADWLENLEIENWLYQHIGPRYVAWRIWWTGDDWWGMHVLSKTPEHHALITLTWGNCDW